MEAKGGGNREFVRAEDFLCLSCKVLSGPAPAEEARFRSMYSAKPDQAYRGRDDASLEWLHEKMDAVIACLMSGDPSSLVSFLARKVDLGGGGIRFVEKLGEDVFPVEGKRVLLGISFPSPASPPIRVLGEIVRVEPMAEGGDSRDSRGRSVLLAVRYVILSADDRERIVGRISMLQRERLGYR